VFFVTQDKPTTPGTNKPYTHAKMY